MKVNVFLCAFGLVAYNAFAQNNEVLGIFSITHTQIANPISGEQAFGIGVSAVGDIDGNGVQDLAVGARIGPTTNRGGLYILFLDSSNNVIDTSRIAYGESGFNQQLGQASRFGNSITGLGDLDGDGNVEIAVGADQYVDSSVKTGAIFILSISSTGLVTNVNRISSNSSGFNASLPSDADFGVSISAAPDLDGDGVNDLIVGAEGVSVVDPGEGALYILYLNTNGTVKSFKVLNRNSINLNLSQGLNFGRSLAWIDDLNGDSFADLIVGAPGGNTINGVSRGSYWILFLNGNQDVIGTSIIADISSNYSLQMDSLGFIGNDVTFLGDISGDGNGDVVIYARSGFIDSNQTNYAAIVHLDSQGGISNMEILKSNSNVFIGFTDFRFLFGSSFGGMDFNNDGKHDLICGGANYNSGEGQINFIYLDGISHISIPEFEQVENWVSISPNPSDGQIAIEQLGSDVTAAEIEVLNVNGQVVHTASLSGQRTTLDLDVPSGNYFVRV
ncbi:MAG: FG-GAP repeat protein, partial [Flavobacteriia bacterium]|nr:FG-GAP repeat protein [Flavobacteriia bacterium]